MKVKLMRTSTKVFEIEFNELYYDGFLENMKEYLPEIQATKEDIENCMKDNMEETPKNIAIRNYIKDYIEAGMRAGIYNRFPVDINSGYEEIFFD